MALNSSIQTLINTGRNLQTDDVANMFYYFYGRTPTAAEKSYWTNKSVTQLYNAMLPNASQFTNAGYYKDVVAPTKTNPVVNSQPQNNTTGGTTTSQTSSSTPKTATSTDLNKTPLGNSGVNSLFKLYYGRNATEEELAYWSQKSDSELRPKLIPNSATELEKRKQEKAQADASVNPQQQNQNNQNNQNNQKNTSNDYTNFDTTQEQTNYILDGNEFLIKFSDDPTDDGIDDTSTIWLYDKDTKNYTPFVNNDALIQHFGGATKANEAMKRLVTLPTSAMSNDIWNGKFVSRKYGIQADGTMPNVPEDGYIKTNIESDDGSDNLDSTSKARYGKEFDEIGTENMTKFVGMLFTRLNKEGLISDATWSKIKTDADNILTKYVNACLYGGYTAGDIFADAKAKDLVAAGNSQYANFKAFDDGVAAKEWYKTADGQKALNDNNVKVDLSDTGISEQLFDNPVYKIASEAFSTIVKPIDWTSDEFKAEAEKIQASWYDIMQQQNEATTEQEYKVAKDNWDIFRKNLEQKYGINLSNNVRTAWNQFQQVTEGMNSAGLAKSGILQEAQDKLLQDVRRGDEILRQEKSDQKDQEYRNYLLNNASADEINQFISSDPTKAGKWGLIPSDDVKNWYSTANLKAKYPDLNDAQIQAIHDTMLDENGNYRSNLYRNLFINKYNLGEEKTTYQQQKLYEQKLEEEKKAYGPWESANPFSSYNPDYADPSKAESKTNLKINTNYNPALSTSSNTNTWTVAKNLSNTNPLTNPTQTLKNQILDTKYLSSYNASDYYRDNSNNKVYLNTGVTPKAGTYKTVYA
jgi:hypothetical protein